jgi:C_GCAxxG_C_C family probable redox protein
MENQELDELLKPFRKDCNCAQTVLLAFREDMGLTEEEVMGLGLGFGGGIARTGQLCGAVSGGVMALGMVCSRAMEDPADAKELTIRVVTQFMEDFREAFGTLYCNQLLDGIDLRTQEGRALVKQENLHEKVCEPAVAVAIRSAGQLVNIVNSE